MKQLKFMLAAATAISLATAAQADLSKSPTSQNFDGWTVGASVPGTDDNGFSYTANDGGNSSVIYQNDEDTANNTEVLNVDTSGQPLLFNVQGKNTGLAEDLRDDDTKSVIIETDVKFTVTTADQTVVPGDDDKLMIYLKQVDEVKDGDTVVTPATTKLMVKALQYRKGGYDEDENLIAPTANVVDCELRKAVDNTAVTVDTGTYYSLKVKSFLVDSVPMFELYLNDAKLAPPSGTKLNMDGTGDAVYYFPSLKAADSTTIQYVGFAGEGYVDNIVVTKEVNEVTPVDFTFALTWLDEKISAVAYTTGGDITITKGENITGYEANGTVALTITPASWYKLVTEGAVTLTLPSATPEEAISLDEYVTEAANVTTGDDGKVTVAVTENTKPSDVGVMAGSFSAADTATAELSKALTWALNKGGATTAAGAGSVVGNLNFANEEDTDAEKAYLLDCTEAELTGEDGEIAKFKFVGFDLTTGFTVGKEKQVANGAAYGNGYVEVRGATAVNGDYTEAANTAKHSFFKAFLVPFQPAAAEVE